MGALVTDFLLIKPGALHRANGGYLLIDARKLLLSPFAWEALKRTIKAGEIRIEQPMEAAGLIGTQTLDPEPIPLDVHVILFGDRELYYMLAAYDPDFTRLFKVQADFDDTIPRSSDNDRAYARLISSIVREHKLNHLDAAGVARLIDEGARLADDREKLSIEVGRIADIVREADYWAEESGPKRHHRRGHRARRRGARPARRSPARPLAGDDRSRHRAGRHERLQGRPDQRPVGPAARRLRVRPADPHHRPRAHGSGPRHRHRARGEARRPAALEGRDDLVGLPCRPLRARLPLALAASLVFEQSYGGVDGDSASSTELYALLSALAEVPIEQGFAVTGSVNQHGEVQAIGGVNEKIEGFFDVCKARGLTGQQGVLIPQSNVQHLMLREDVVDAVRQGQFTVWSVATIDQGIEILTGIKAGTRGPDGQFPPGTVYRRAEDKLREFADRSKQFLQQQRPSTGGNEATS